MKSKNVTIPNWTMFGTHSVTVEIHTAGIDEEDNPMYQAAYGFFLDDGTLSLEEAVDLPVNDQKHITIFTGQLGLDPDKLVIQAAAFISEAFENINVMAYIFEDDGAAPREVNIQTLVESTVLVDGARAIFH
jgi:dihydroxyacid dehydratase/phosphogluconate dehydratase